MKGRRFIIVPTAEFLSVINKELETMTNVVDRDEAIVQWREAAKNLSLWKDVEATLRAQIATTYFDPTKEKGTENLELGAGYKLKCVKKLTAKIDRARIDAKLDAIEALGEKPKFIAERMFKWTPELYVTEWNDVYQRAEGGDLESQQIMEILIGAPGETPVVTFAPGMPSLEFVEPKK